MLVPNSDSQICLFCFVLVLFPTSFDISNRFFAPLLCFQSDNHWRKYNKELQSKEWRRFVDKKMKYQLQPKEASSDDLTAESDSDHRAVPPTTWSDRKLARK